MVAGVSKRRKTKGERFFEKMYIPPLVKAGNKDAIRTVTARNARARQTNAFSFAGLDKEIHREIARRGGKSRMAKASLIERLAVSRKANEAYRKLPKDVRRAYAQKGAKALWANITPEERARRLNILAMQGKITAGKRLAKRQAEWPFEWKSRLSVGELNRRRAAKRRLQKFLDHTKPNPTLDKFLQGKEIIEVESVDADWHDE